MSKDFENKAKSLGDDFSLQPRENVWMRIEEALDEKKHRRVAWWWWAAPVALLLGSGIWYFAAQEQTGNNAEKTAAVAKTETSHPAGTSEEINNKTANTSTNQEPAMSSGEGQPLATQKNDISTSNSLSDQHIKPTISRSYQQKNSQPANNYSSDGLDQHAPQTASGTRTPSNPEVKNVQPTVIAGPAATNGDDKPVVQSGQTVPVQPQPTTASAEPGTPDVANTGATNSDHSKEEQLSNTEAAKENSTTNIVVDKEKEELNDSQTQAELASKKSGVTENNNKKKATWLIQAGAGMSSMGDLNSLKINGQSSADQLQNSFNPSVIVPTPTRSDKAGLSLSLGIQRKQAISKRWQWSASLAWQYQQIQQYKGIKVDSNFNLVTSGANFSNNYYYTAGSNASERGSNHRIMLNNELSWQVLKNKPWLRLGAGLYTGYNISNNFYVADHMQRLVKNDELYSKWFIGLSPSLQFELKNNIKINLNTHIDFTKAYKELNGDPKYWRGWEVRADFPIFKK